MMRCNACGRITRYRRRGDWEEIPCDCLSWVVEDGVITQLQIGGQRRTTEDWIGRRVTLIWDKRCSKRKFSIHEIDLDPLGVRFGGPGGLSLGTLHPSDLVPAEEPTAELLIDLVPQRTSVVNTLFERKHEGEWRGEWRFDFGGDTQTETERGEGCERVESAELGSLQLDLLKAEKEAAHETAEAKRWRTEYMRSCWNPDRVRGRSLAVACAWLFSLLVVAAVAGAVVWAAAWMAG